METEKNYDENEVLPDDSSKVAENVENSNNTSDPSDLRDDGSNLSDTVTNDLYDDIDDWPRLSEKSLITPLAALNPQDIAEYDSKNESVILSQTNALHKTLYFCNKIVDACFKVGDFVPDLSVDQNTVFWMNSVSFVKYFFKRLQLLHHI